MTKPKIICTGTLRPQDLIPIFLDELEARNPSAAEQITIAPLGPQPNYAWKDDSAEWWNSQDASDLVAELFDALDECAPEGYYFGAHKGDGACFGYWPIEPEDNDHNGSDTMPTYDNALQSTVEAANKAMIEIANADHGYLEEGELGEELREVWMPVANALGLEAGDESFKRDHPALHAYADSLGADFVGVTSDTHAVVRWEGHADLPGQYRLFAIETKPDHEDGEK